jgi:hypothetical protein
MTIHDVAPGRHGQKNLNAVRIARLPHRLIVPPARLPVYWRLGTCP